MSASLTAYTHLESLLLFQSLHAYGLANPNFSRISGLLKSIPAITTDKSYQSGRLSPDALHDFYLRILKDELRSERQHEGASDSDAQTADVRNTRKRKAPSPPLPTVQEAQQHAHLIPKLVNKLYARYRTQVVREIAEEEDRYERLQRELQAIERGDRDAELLDRANRKSPVPRSPSLARKSPSLHQKPLPSSPSPQLAVQDGSRVGTPSATTRAADGPLQPGTEAYQHLLPQNGPPQPLDRKARPTQQASPHRSPGGAAVPQSLSSSFPPMSPAPVPTASPQQTRTPQPLPPSPYPQPPPVNAGFNGPLAGQHRSPYAPQPSPSQAQLPRSVPHPGAGGPSVPGHPLQHHTQPSSVPPSPGAPFHHPNLQASPYGGNGAHQFGHGQGPLPQFSPTQQRHPGLTRNGPQSPSALTPQQQRGYFPGPGQSPYPPQGPQPGQPPPQGGFMLPTFQVSPQDPSRSHQQATPHMPQVSTPGARQPLPPTRTAPTITASFRPGHQPVPHPARASFSTPSHLRTPFSAHSSPRSARSLWRTTISTPPAPRPAVAPIDDIPPLDHPKQSQPKAKPPRKPRIKAKAKEKEQETEKEAEKAPAVPDKSVSRNQPEEQAAEGESHQGRSRRETAAKRGRPGSVVSLRERSRSQSIISHTETIAENESQPGSLVKSERGTPIDANETPVGTPSQLPRPRRGSNLQVSRTKGRKRTAREASLPEVEDEPLTLGFPKMVIAPRNFSKTCKEAMNEITSHKHASIFANPVKPKDAEGYYEIIKRPTDLKSIQKAINFGAKAVNGAATDTPTGSPGGGGAIVELPLSADVIPPKAIVNSAQLEKEIMRMFTNAVMFNAGEEGVVEDARQMSEACQRIVSNWRSAERSTGRLEVEETPAPEEEAPAASKRRKT